MGLPRPFTVRGAFYSLYLRVFMGGECCCMTVKREDCRHRWHFFYNCWPHR